MSADLDAIAREAALAVMEDLSDRRGIKSEIRQISDAVIEEIVTDHARIARVYLDMAIAQDRKTREDELTRERSQLHFTTERLSEAHKQLAQQSAALVVAEKALKELVYAELNSRDQFTHREIDAIEAAMEQAKRALAQLAEAPRENAGHGGSK